MANYPILKFGELKKLKRDYLHMRAYHENLDQKRKEKKRKEPSLRDYLYVTRMWSHE
jgi:hypothetical protein